MNAALMRGNGPPSVFLPPAKGVALPKSGKPLKTPLLLLWSKKGRSPARSALVLIFSM